MFVDPATALGGPALPGPLGIRDALTGVRAPWRVRQRLLLMASATAGDAAVADPPGPIAGARAGVADDLSQISMEHLVREHADAVYRVALSVTKDPVLAEDASQNALIKAWQGLPTYRADAPLRHWMLRIAHNESVSLLRRRRESAISPFDMSDQPAMLRSVEVEVEDRLAIERFEEALGDLDVVSRSIVVLREVEGLAYGEICDVLDLPLPTVRTRLLRARRRLAAALDGWQP